MMNWIRLIVISYLLMIFYGLFFGSNDKPSSTTNVEKDQVIQAEGQSVKKASPIDELIAAKTDPLSPNGELAELFSVGSNSTQLQRQEELKKIKGKIVQWTLRVSDVTHVFGDRYQIQSDSETPIVGESGQHKDLKKSVSAIIKITAESEQEKSILLGLKSGSDVCIKGKLTGDTVLKQSLEIKPAVLCSLPKKR